MKHICLEPVKMLGGACNTKGSVLRGYPLNVPLSMKVTTKIRLVTHLQQEEINMP